MAVRGFTYVVAKRLGKIDLDVLADAPHNDGHGHIPFGPPNKSLFEGLVQPAALTWERSGLSDFTSLPIAAVPGQEATHPAQTLMVQEQGGARNEMKLPRQRSEGLTMWTVPVRAQRPPQDTAWIFLVRDDTGEVHARYLNDLSTVPEVLARRLNSAPKYEALEFEAGLVVDDPLLARVVAALRAKHNVILYGPPGTGKTHLMLQVAKAFQFGITNVVFDPADLAAPFKSQGGRNISDRKKRSHEFVTFHGSTSYETFVTGLRPQVAANGHLVYEPVPGPLLRMAGEALAADSAALLLVDEVNRGNTAEIFGELITLLEVDKRRSPENQVVPHRTVETRLPWRDDPFSMPYHFYLLASMNSVDRTVAPLDSALRRRFRIIEVPPDLPRLRAAAQQVIDSMAGPEAAEFAKIARLAHNLLAALNAAIALSRGPDFRLGHSYLWSVVEGTPTTADDRAARLVHAFAETILPQLQELFRDQPDELFALLGGEFNEGQLFRYHRQQVTGFQESTGWIQLLPFPGPMSRDEQLAVLDAIAAGAPDAWTAEPEESDPGEPADAGS